MQLSPTYHRRRRRARRTGDASSGRLVRTGVTRPFSSRAPEDWIALPAAAILSAMRSARWSARRRLGARRARDADPAHLHALRLARAMRGCELLHAGRMERVGSIDPAIGETYDAERHPVAPHHAGVRASRARRRVGGTRRRGQRRRVHGRLPRSSGRVGFGGIGAMPGLRSTRRRPPASCSRTSARAPVLARRVEPGATHRRTLRDRDGRRRELVERARFGPHRSPRDAMLGTRSRLERARSRPGDYVVAFSTPGRSGAAHARSGARFVHRLRPRTSE